MDDDVDGDRGWETLLLFFMMHENRYTRLYGRFTIEGAVDFHLITAFGEVHPFQGSHGTAPWKMM